MSALFDAIARAISAAGTSEFAPLLLTVLRLMVRADKVELYRGNGDRAGQIVGAAGAEAGTVLGETQVAGSLGPSDDMEIHGAAPAATHRGGYDQSCITRLVVESGSNFSHDSGIVDALMCKWEYAAETRWVVIYRHASNGMYTKADIERLCALRPLIVSLVDSEIRAKLRDERLYGLEGMTLADRLADEMAVSLTMRERAVVARIVLGMNTDAIARELAIKATTVVTFRKRAYAKLCVASRSELFALCMRTMTRGPRHAKSVPGTSGILAN